jgi:hypothetical protein
MFAPAVGSQPLSRRAWGPLSVPYRPGTPTYRIQDKTRSRACIHALPCALQLRTMHLCQGGLRRCHVSYSSGPCLPVEVGSSAATCLMTPDLAPLLKWAPVPLHVQWLRISLRGRRGLRHRHMSRDSGPLFPVEMGSGVAACPMALDPASLSRRALALTHALWFPMGRGPHE